MNLIKSVGLFGKLPAHGDFIYRDLPTNFINTWDAWLQGFVGSSQEQLGEAWLDIYLTSPIWRFSFSEGVIDEHVWAGIVLPSVDRVGRYFPFSIATRLSDGANPIDVINHMEWFESMESAALRALEGQLSIDALVDEINHKPLKYSSGYVAAAPTQHSVGTHITLDDDALPASALPSVLNGALKGLSPSYSVWSTQGSQYVEPCLFHTMGLPQMRGISALLDGQWEQWGWHEPAHRKII